MTNPLTPAVLAAMQSYARGSLVIHIPQELALPLIAAAMRDKGATAEVAAREAELRGFEAAVRLALGTADDEKEVVLRAELARRRAEVGT